jgi:hypothetical protein
MYQSPAALVDAVSDFLISERLESFPAGDLFAKRAKIVNGSTNLFQRPASLGNDASHRLVMPRDDNLFPTRNSVQQFSETGFRFQGGNGTHSGFSWQNN